MSLSLPLDPSRMYLAFDRWVCGTVGCAGMTAYNCGVTLGGFPLSVLSALDVMESEQAGVGLSCECGRATAQVLGGRVQVDVVGGR